ncbi:MAG: XdhC/CoxI family protein [Candidatus Moduliflexus flocculans]|nr:XdhC/CoxI family protein [Candidatus Moduliflexus flocculans]
MGSKMLVYPDGKFIGTVGGGELENRVIEEALDVAAGRSAAPACILQHGLTRRAATRACAAVRWRCSWNRSCPAAMVVVIGAGHVGKAVVAPGEMAGIPGGCQRRPRRVLHARSPCPGRTRTTRAGWANWPMHIKIDARTFLMLTTRGSNVDAAGLARVCSSLSAAYIGVIGSKRRWADDGQGVEGTGCLRGKLIAQGPLADRAGIAGGDARRRSRSASWRRS